MERRTRDFEADGSAWRAVVARRGPSGHALLYFVPLDGDAPAEDDRNDRRSGLEPGRELADLDDDGLRSHLAGSTPLTETERRFRAPDGRLWLAQSEGPVWADGGVAEGLTGIVLTSLEGRSERLAAPGGHVGRLGADELARRWRAAAGADGQDPSAGGENAGDRAEP